MLQPQLDFLKPDFKRDQRPGLEQESLAQVEHPPPQLEPVETTAVVVAGAASLVGARSAPAIMAEVSMNNVAFTVTNLR